MTGDSRGPFASPFDDSRAPSRAGSEEDLNTQTVSEKFNILPSAGLLLFPEDVEKDDYLHNPDPNEKEQRDCDIFTRRGLVNVGGLAFLALGLLALFVGYPVLYVPLTVQPLHTFLTRPQYFRRQDDKTGKGPLHRQSIMYPGQAKRAHIIQHTKGAYRPRHASRGNDAHIGHRQEAEACLLGRVQRRWAHILRRRRPVLSGRRYLVWCHAGFGGKSRTRPNTAVSDALQWYDPDAAWTQNGTLVFEFARHDNHGLKYRSGMVQSWNKLCYKGGHLEASISLPGMGNVSGFWPGFWTMGNLARPGYLGSTEGLWPYSYDDVCDLGITANQSSYDGLSYLPGMKLPACSCSGEDHPSPGTSRSAPEIDALEGSVHFLGPGETNAVGVVSQSFQAAPFDIWYQPDYGESLPALILTC
jgi:hypothetical protein